MELTIMRIDYISENRQYIFYINLSNLCIKRRAIDIYVKLQGFSALTFTSPAQALVTHRTLRAAARLVRDNYRLVFTISQGKSIFLGIDIFFSESTGTPGRGSVKPVRLKRSKLMKRRCSVKCEFRNKRNTPSAGVPLCSSGIMTEFKTFKKSIFLLNRTVTHLQRHLS